MTITGPSTGLAKSGSATKLGSGGTNMPTLANSDSFGGSVANLGDLDGDGVADLAVGAKGNETGAANRGAFHILIMEAKGSIKFSTTLASDGGRSVSFNAPESNSGGCRLHQKWDCNEAVC